MLDDDPAINCFKDLGTGSIPPELINSVLSSPLESLEHFAISVKKLGGELLPPTCAALLPHILHANCVTMQDKSYLTNCLELPPIEQVARNGTVAQTITCIATLYASAMMENVSTFQHFCNYCIACDFGHN